MHVSCESRSWLGEDVEVPVIYLSNSEDWVPFCLILEEHGVTLDDVPLGQLMAHWVLLHFGPCNGQASRITSCPRECRVGLVRYSYIIFSYSPALIV